MNNEQVKKLIAAGKGWLDLRKAKYRRNLNRYTDSVMRGDDVDNLYGFPVGYYKSPTQEDTGINPTMNICRSMVDTLVSKISQTKVRPFFNPVNGTFKTVKACRAAQTFFDEMFTKEKIYRKGSMALRDAAIFEAGALWVNDISGKVEEVSPWEYFFDPAEYYHGQQTWCYVYRKLYPVAMLRDLVKKDVKYKDALELNWSVKCDYVVFYDLAEKMRHRIVDGMIMESTPIDYNRVPVALLWYTPPVKGAFSTSIIDNVLPIQLAIDNISQKIHESVTLSPAMFTLIAKGAGLKASMMDNRIGNVYEYMPLPSGGGQPMTITPPPIDPGYERILNFLEAKAYNMEGISQLSAQSKKPSDLSSGKALETLEDITSERFEDLMSRLIAFYMEIAEIIIDVMPEDSNILPDRIGRSKTTWKDIKKARNLFTIQFSATTSLSKDPKTKLEQVQQLINMGIIKPETASSLLEFPDIENAYSVAAAAYDDCQRIIERALDDGTFDFYESINLKQLYGEAVNTLLRLDANDEKPEVMARLVQLMTKVKAQMEDVAKVGMPLPMPIPGQPGQPGPMPAESALPQGIGGQ